MYQIYEDDPAYVFDERVFNYLEDANVEAAKLHIKTGHQVVVYKADKEGHLNTYDGIPVTVFHNGYRFDHAVRVEQSFIGEGGLKR